jgi:paraquat-inducible protein A
MTQRKSLHDLYPRQLIIPFLILLSAVLLMMGLSKPVLTVRKLWESNTFSILSGITTLWHEKYHGLAVLIFFFSIVFPIAKLASLLVLWIIKLEEGQRKKIINFLEVFGKWSMLDVFVTAVLVVCVKLGALASAKAEIGIYFFGTSIVLAMIISGLQNHLAKKI